MDAALSTWWHALCAAAGLNLCLLIWSARRLMHRVRKTPELLAARGLQLWLSAGYVLGCGFRSIFPMVDVPRFCLHDTWISRIAVGRTVATIAELCFAYQWALLLREAGPRRTAAGLAGRLIFPIIIAAELFSWGAVAMTNYLLHAIENSLWTLAAALALAGFASSRPHTQGSAARFVSAACVCATGYVVYMVTVDVPMYLHRWREESLGSLPLAHGLKSLLNRCIVATRWEDWHHDVPWLSLYFTVAVWISLALAHAPSLRRSAHV